MNIIFVIVMVGIVILVVLLLRDLFSPLVHDYNYNNKWEKYFKENYPDDWENRLKDFLDD